MLNIYSKKIITHLVLVITMILWSSSFIALKIGLTQYNPFEVIAGRMFVASIFCLPLAKELWKAMKNKKNAQIIVLGVFFEPCLYFLCESFAMHYTSASQAAMVLALVPIFIALGAYFLLKEYLSLNSWLGFIIAIFGIAWLTLGSEQSQSAPNPVLGNLLEFGAVICAVGYTLCIRYVAQSVRPIVLTAAMAFGGTLFFAPLTLLPVQVEPLLIDAQIPTWMPIASIVYLGFVVSLAGYGGYNYALARLPAGEVAPYINLIPIITMLMGVMFLNEELEINQYLASGLVILGVIVSQVTIKKKNKRSLQ